MAATKQQKIGLPPPPLVTEISYKLRIFMYADAKYETIPPKSRHIGEYYDENGKHVGERFLVPKKKE